MGVICGSPGHSHVADLVSGTVGQDSFAVAVGLQKVGLTKMENYSSKHINIIYLTYVPNNRGTECGYAECASILYNLDGLCIELV